MSGQSEKEIQQQKNRFRDLAQKAFTQNSYTFTGFLGLAEQDAFWQIEPEIRYAGYTLFGGIEQADRKMVRFGDPKEWGYETAFPIVCIHIEPLLHKFADALSHRDFLGALMNLGIDRSTLGDIQVGDKEAYLFCTETIADFICENLSQVRHTHVKAAVTQEIATFAAREPQPELVQVVSLRIDAVVAKVVGLSRSECALWFRTGKIFVDGRLCENTSRMLKPGETVNARGFGKFIYSGERGQTRKGKCNVEVLVFR